MIMGLRHYTLRIMCHLSGVTQRTSTSTFLLIEVQVSPSIEITLIGCNSSALLPAVQVAEKLHETLWGKELSAILEVISGDEGTWKYVLEKYINLLEMSQLGYPERVLLV